MILDRMKKKDWNEYTLGEVVLSVCMTGFAILGALSTFVLFLVALVKSSALCLVGGIASFAITAIVGGAALYTAKE